MSELRVTELIADAFGDGIAPVLPRSVEIEHANDSGRFILIRQQITVDAFESERGSSSYVTSSLQFLSESKFDTKTEFFRIKNCSVLHVADEIAPEIAIEHGFGYGNRFHSFFFQDFLEREEIVEVPTDTVELEYDNPFPFFAFANFFEHFGKYGTGTLIGAMLFGKNPVDYEAVLSGILLDLVHLRWNTQVLFGLLVRGNPYVSEISTCFSEHNIPEIISVKTTVIFSSFFAELNVRIIRSKAIL